MVLQLVIARGHFHCLGLPPSYNTQRKRTHDVNTRCQCVDSFRLLIDAWHWFPLKTVQWTLLNAMKSTKFIVAVFRFCGAIVANIDFVPLEIVWLSVVGTEGCPFTVYYNCLVCYLILLQPFCPAELATDFFFHGFTLGCFVTLGKKMAFDGGLKKKRQ